MNRVIAARASHAAADSSQPSGMVRTSCHVRPRPASRSSSISKASWFSQKPFSLSRATGGRSRLPNSAPRRCSTRVVGDVPLRCMPSTRMAREGCPVIASIERLPSYGSRRPMATAGTLPPGDPPGDGAHPTVSVVSLNYNGRRYLERFLRSALALDYPPPCYRVVIVDNGSTDGSVDLVRERFPQVHIVEAGRNLGFAGGCNLGIRATRSEYVALVNNDTVVERDWLRPLVEVAESDPRVGLVGSKMLFLTPFLDLGLEALAEGRAGPGVPGAPALVLHEARVAGCDYDKLMFRAGHLGADGDDGRSVHVLASPARLAVPTTRADAPATLVLTLCTAPSRGDSTIGVTLGDAEIGRLALTRTPRTFRLEVSREIVAPATHDMINNAGTRVDGEGRFGDRGIFEFDDGQYDVVDDVPALCGASVLLRRDMLEGIGAFDTRYFMYFEDIDLSWRARRAGWRVVYTQRSQLR